MSGFRSLTDHNPGLRSQSSQQPQHRRFRHRNAAGGRPEIFAGQMQKYRAAEAGDARRSIVIDLDNEIIQVVVAGEPVAEPPDSGYANVVRLDRSEYNEVR